MKFLVWLLLLVNAMLFGYFELLAPRQGEAVPVRDMQPGRIRILTAAELTAMSKPEVVAATPAAQTQMTVSPEPAAVADVCYEWGSFAGPDALRAKEALNRLALPATAKKHTPQEAIRYWVYIPSLKTPEAAQAKAAEVRAMGIAETFIIQDPKWRNAISLGVFRDEGLANKFLEDLRGRGVKSAIKGQRSLDGEQTGYQIRNMTPAQQDEISKLGPDFPGSDLKQIDCK